jgi:hypothetical protein
MAVDPLSAATRSAKRNLLIASTLAITYRVFDIKIDKIPVSGFSLDFDPGVFVFLLAIALLYLTLIFALYYYIDIKNVEETPHETGMTKTYSDGVWLFSRRSAGKLKPIIASHLPPKYHFGSTDNIYIIFEDVANASLRDAILFRLKYDVSKLKIVKSVEKDKNTFLSLDVTPETDPELFKEIDRAARPHLRYHWWAARINKLRYMRLRWTAVAVYPFRNYVVDGLLPLVTAALAFAALYRLLDLSWMRVLTPTN